MHDPAFSGSSKHFGDRRLFLKAAASIAASAQAFAINPALAVEESVALGEHLNIGIMGVNNRGAALAKGLSALANVNLAYICDVDSRAAERVASSISKDSSSKPVIKPDFRSMLDDKQVHALVIAAPNHWHAPATILACAAGKHVYVEKPCSHTPLEGELAVEASRKHNRVVTMGSQRRSWPAIQDAIAKIHEGAIGKVHYARTWYNNRRDSIGTAQPSVIPDWLDWDLWQGPAPRRTYRDNVLHYHWHWNWHWGNGELGNNGIHGLDVARWGMNVKYPLRVTAGGGKYRHRDDQDTPDTMMVTYDFPDDKTITWEGLSWSPLGPHQSRFGISFHGTEGSIVIHDPGYTLFDMHDKEVSTHTDRGGDSDHLADFLKAIRTSSRPNAEIEEAHQSTLLCHLGNIAYRTRQSLDIDPSNGHIKNLESSDNWWSKEYEKGWELKV
jgi:predicted dehydrogenase